MTLAHSPLHDRHLQLGAKMAEFGGWEMPLEYAGGGVLAEHKAVREAVGVFDVSHLGKATVEGPGAAAYLDRCLTNAFDRIGPGQAQYTLCCDESGGVVDDLIGLAFGVVGTAASVAGGAPILSLRGDGAFLTEGDVLTPVALSVVALLGPSLQNAVIAVEDSRFYDHRGVDDTTIVVVAPFNYKELFSQAQS